MSAFIHGEVSRIDPVSVVTDNLQRMMRAVEHYPWRSASTYELSTDPFVCAMGVQWAAEMAGRGDDPFQPRMATHIAADLHLHGRDELVSRLGMSRQDGSTLTDEAVVLRAYDRWGLDFAEHILGDGVFAIWDPSERRLICWRDAAGVRPLYYLHSPGRRLVFSSDLQSIAAHPDTPAHLDLEYANAVLRNEQFQHPTRTLIEGVRKVPPAHVFVLDTDGLQIRRYWDPMTVLERKSATDAGSVEELLDLLSRSIDDRLPKSGKGVGAHLSGGLDSSSVALMAANLLQNQGNDLSAYSWAPPREVVEKIERDERDLVEAAASFAAIRPRFTLLTPADVVDVAYRDVALRPRATLNFEVATSRDAVAMGVRTIFSGWGGDEMIALNGRGYFADQARRGHLPTVHRELKLRSKIQGGSLRGAWKARVFLPMLPEWILRNGSTQPRPLPAELRPEFARELSSAESLERPFPRERPGVHRMQASLLQFGHLQYRMESWAAHGAGIGLSYTFPLLDRRIMEFALGLPGSMFFRDGWKRWLYRTAMDGVLPEIVRWNPKKYDDAAGIHLRRVLREMSALYEEPLLGRRDNPLVDVGVLLAEQERQRQPRSSPTGFASPPPTSPVGGGAWLAFTKLRPA